MWSSKSYDYETLRFHNLEIAFTFLLYRRPHNLPMSVNHSDLAFLVLSAQIGIHGYGGGSNARILDFINQTLIVGISYVSFVKLGGFGNQTFYLQSFGHL